MSVLSSAIGAILAAIVEVGMLGHLHVASIRPDFVLSCGIAVAMVLGFEAGITWAFVGGLTLDVLTPERAMGGTALALVITVGLGLLITRATWPPRTVVILGVTFLLALLYHGLLLSILWLTTGVDPRGASLERLALVAALDVLVTAAAVVVVRALDLRFGDTERAAW